MTNKEKAEIRIIIAENFRLNSQYIYDFKKLNTKNFDKALLKYASEKNVIRFKSPKELERHWEEVFGGR